MGLVFTWDSRKATMNLGKHKIAFEEATAVFGDPFSLTIPDPVHSGTEERWVSMGMSNRKRVLVVVHTEQAGNIRIISARIATAAERKFYEESQ